MSSLSTRWPKILVILSYSTMSAVSGIDDASPQPIETDIRDELLKPLDAGGRFFSETTAEKFADKYGVESVPILIDLLQEDGIHPAHKGKISFYLGKIKPPSNTTIHPAVEPIMKLIEDQRNNPCAEDEQFMIGFAMLGLGFTGENAAIDYLESKVDAANWTGYQFVPFSPPGSDFGSPEDCLIYLRLRAVRGISVSAKPESLKVLNRLKKGKGSDFAGKISSNKKYCKKRIREGKSMSERLLPYGISFLLLLICAVGVKKIRFTGRKTASLENQVD